MTCLICRTTDCHHLVAAFKTLPGGETHAGDHEWTFWQRVTVSQEVQTCRLCGAKQSRRVRE